MSRRIGLRYMQITGGVKFPTTYERFRNRGFETGVAIPWTKSGGAGNDVTNTAAHTGSWSFKVSAFNQWLQQLFLTPYPIKSNIATFEFWHLGGAFQYKIFYNGGLSSQWGAVVSSGVWVNIIVTATVLWGTLPSNATIEGIYLLSTDADPVYFDDFSCIG